MRLLIDECLSLTLVATAQAAGHDAQHLVHLGKAGWRDWSVLGYACDDDRVLVTNNAVDFQKLYARQPLHPGLIIILPNVGLALQQQLFAAALAEAEAAGHLTNQVLEVLIDASEIVVIRYDLPA